MNLTIRAIKPSEKKYLYSKTAKDNDLNGCIGHLRGDMDSSGNGFYTTWDNHVKERNNDEFKAEFDNVVNALRFDERFGGILKNRTSLAGYCYGHPDGGMEGNYCTEYGFRADSEKFTYMIRCNPNKGDYNFYIYAYLKDMLENSMKSNMQKNSELPEVCMSTLNTTGEVIVIKKGEQGYYPYFNTSDKLSNREFVDKFNELHEITKAQESAMVAGSMHGWNVPAANPGMYDENGKPDLEKWKENNKEVTAEEAAEEDEDEEEDESFSLSM